MPQVTSRKTIDFPTLSWSIGRGETKELPESQEAQDIILNNQFISKVSVATESKPKSSVKKLEDKE